MKRFLNESGSAELDLCIQYAEALLTANSPMMREVMTKGDFRYDSGHGLEVVAELYKERPPIRVYTYSKRFSRAIGYFDGKSIFVNTAKKLSTLERTANLIHEYAHYCGFHHIDAGFWGKRNANKKTEQKCLYSVPYYLSENISRWITGEKA